MTTSQINYKRMQKGDENTVSDLIYRVFMEFVAPEYSTEGIREFNKYIEPSKFLQRLINDHFCLLAVNEGFPVGVIEVRKSNHISLLFVDKTMMGKGIAKELVNQAIQICQREDPANKRLDVYSSPFALKIYKKLGFHEIGPPQTKNGITFIPMERLLFE
jgi:GNAT superfamily N-acetyltransferase